MKKIEKHAKNLQILIQKAAEKTIPKRKTSNRSKPWWNDHINKLRKTLSREKNRWKKSRTKENHEQYQQARNCYFNEIKIAKSNCWNQFLEKAEGKEIFKAFTYTKQKRIKRLPIITYSDRNNGRKAAITFNQKCDVFLTSLFHLSLASEPPDWSSYIEKEWEWPEILIDKIKEAIFSNSNKKAPRPDQISFFIIQKAYNSIPEYFYHIYQNLIRLDHHPKCWKTAIGVILKKLKKKRNWSEPKSYRIISLLNYLDKIAV